MDVVARQSYTTEGAHPPRAPPGASARGPSPSVATPPRPTKPTTSRQSAGGTDSRAQPIRGGVGSPLAVGTPVLNSFLIDGTGVPRHHCSARQALLARLCPSICLQHRAIGRPTSGRRSGLPPAVAHGTLSPPATVRPRLPARNSSLPLVAPLKNLVIF